MVYFQQLSKVLATIVRFTPSQFQQIMQKEKERDAAHVNIHQFLLSQTTIYKVRAQFENLYRDRER